MPIVPLSLEQQLYLQQKKEIESLKQQVL